MASAAAASTPTSVHTHLDLQALPLEILDKIAYFTALVSHPTASSSTSIYPTTPPHALRNFVLTSRYIHQHVGIASNPALYARIFRAKFDLPPIARRYGLNATTVEALAAELVKRCTVLKRIKRAGELGQLRPEGDSDVGEATMKDNLWLAYLMMTENDGNNLLALFWADVRLYLSLHHTQEMLRSALQPGYPPESEDRALAMHLRYLLADGNLLIQQTKEDAEEQLFVLRPFVFASHKFDGFFAPWPLRKLPVAADGDTSKSDALGHGPSLLQRNQGAPIPMPDQALEGSTPQEAAGGQGPVPTNPFLADHTPRYRGTKIEHVGQALSIRPPCIVHAAYHLFFGQIEAHPELVGLTAITRRPSASAGAPTGATGQAANGTAQSNSERGVASGSPSDSHRPLLLRANPRRLTSTDHDRDIVRLLSCHSPLRAPGLKPCFFAGIVSGAWEGRFSFLDFDSYREMLAGRMRSLYEGPFGEQPQVWKLQEHFLRVDESDTTTGKREGGQGSIVSAGFLDDEPFEETMALPSSIAELHERERERGHGTSKREAPNSGSVSNSGSKRREAECTEDDCVQRELKEVALLDGKTGSHTVHQVLPCDLSDLSSYPEFSAEDGGPSAGYGHLPSGTSIRLRPCGQDGAEGEVEAEADGSRYEMLISGSGHSAWGSFVLRGRIRAWDGMMILTKEYRPDGRGRWLYRGYITAGGCLIGRWRDSFTPGDMSGYEGPFVLHRRALGVDE